ncbi:WD repeat-containing protein 13 [Anabrus simplex]|uniref:WD repeat-containing protein 13 n=1 Tax=Anabrus simplex TaxID=316456 RepID=UPI0035A317D3
MATVWQQQVFALDARYNAHRAPNHPNFRTLYIRRRSQLLREYSRTEDPTFRKQYLKLRGLLLQQRYGVNCDQNSIRSRSISAKSSSRISESPESFRFQSENVSPQEMGGVVPTRQAEASRAIVGGTTIAENYAFVGVHHIFDQHTAAVTMLKFANNDRSRLGCASLDGTVSVCNVTASPPHVEVVFRGHKKGVTGFDWSVSNDLMVSCSLDGTICLWNIASSKCLRVVRDPIGAELLSCLFQPANNNMVIAGNSQGMVEVLNVSTGIYPRGGSSKLGGKVLSLAFDSTGVLLWAGNNKGTLVSFLFDAETGRLSKCRRVVVAENCQITCISWRAWISREARDPTLLVNCAANVVCLFRVIDKEGGLKLRRKFSIRHKSSLIRSTFCPIMSFRQGACVVTGSEDSCVYFLDIEREGKACVNKLQGHACPVLGVSFNYDESLLATSDNQGLVIIWKREKRPGSAAGFQNS